MSTPGEHTTPGGAPTGTTAQEEQVRKWKQRHTGDWPHLTDQDAHLTSSLMLLSSLLPLSLCVQEWSWLFDFIQSFLRSPTWTTPLHNFIDDHCGQFSTDDENRLEYTTIHAQFVELVERLLSKNLKEIGVSEEQFVAAVASGASSDDALNRVIFGQILAVDDFLTFKKMMTQRNAELEVESMRTLATYSPSDEEEAQLQLELALALSQSEGDSGAAKKKKSDFSEDDLAAALRLSMLDVERHQSEYEREQAELEHAIAMSLAAEAERLRLREAAEEAEREAAAAAAKAAAEAKSTPVPPVVPATVAALPIVVGQPIAKAPVPPMTIKAPLAVPATIAVPSTAATAAATSSVAAPAKPVAGALPPIAASSLKLGSLPPLSVNKSTWAQPTASEVGHARAGNSFAHFFLSVRVSSFLLQSVSVRSIFPSPPLRRRTSLT